MESQQFDKLKKDSSSDAGYLKTNKMRDQYIIFTLVIIVLYLLYVWYTGQQKEGLDNRPRWNLGGLRDDTGSTNPKSVFGRGYALDQTSNGARVMQDGFGLAFGQSSYQAGGKTQSEYGGHLGDVQGFKNPFDTLKGQRPVKAGMVGKERLDQKEHLDGKTTDAYLQTQLYGQK